MPSAVATGVDNMTNAFGQMMLNKMHESEDRLNNRMETFFEKQSELNANMW